MHPLTGRAIDGLDHIRQSIRTILTTPIGSRVERREFGSYIPELIDQPANAATRLRVMAASAGAITRWEPRVKLTRIAVATSTAPGTMVIDITGIRIDGPRPQPITLDISIPIGASA